MTITITALSGKSRTAFRNGTCKVCSCKINKGTDTIYQASLEGLPKRRYICESCAKAFENGEAPAPQPQPEQPAPAAADAAKPSPTLKNGNGTPARQELEDIISFSAAASGQAMIGMFNRVTEIERMIEDGEIGGGAGGVSTIHVKVNDQPEIEVDGLTHELFPKVLKRCKAGFNVMLVGPTGSGKSHLCKQIAAGLGFDTDTQFGMLSCSMGMSEGQVTGRLLPTGKDGKFEYLISEFIRIYENGGLFLFDEMDAADPNVLLVINAALANGRCPVPNRTDKPYAERHENFVCICACNTWGSGADRQYVGRARLDESTLDRFRLGTFEMDYSRDLEAQLCPHKPMAERLWKLRDAIREHRLERVVSTRVFADAYKAIKTCDDTVADVIAMITQSWREDERVKCKV